MTLETFPFDAAKYLRSPDSQAELLADAFETGDPIYIAHALQVVARARARWNELEATADVGTGPVTAEDTQDPRLSTLLGVVDALGMKLSLVAPGQPS